MSTIRWASTVAFVVALAGCAAGRIEGMAQALPAGGYGLTVELVNFVFRPNVITVDAERPIMVTAVSRSIAKHNVTVISSDGELVADVDVPAGQTRTFEMTLRRPGSYELYCVIGLHKSLGMAGLFVAR